MDRAKALEFIDAYSYKYFYQPVVFVPDRLEMNGRWHQATKELAEILFVDIRGKRILDLGCNIGFFLHEALRRGASEATGVDHDVVEVSIARRLTEVFDDNANIIQSNIDDFLPDCKFDIILLLNVCYALSNPFQVIQRYRRHCLKHLIVEHDCNKQSSLPLACSIIKSPRCAGNRNISYYSPLEI